MSDGTVRRYVLQDGRSVNVARCQDANGNIHILTSGCKVVPASDYDALRTQARELAAFIDAAGNCFPDCDEVTAIMKTAQAVLKEGR